MEVAVLKRLQKSSMNVCEFLGCGKNDNINYVVMSLLGPSLSELRKHQPNQHFSISTTLRTGLQIVAAVQYMHDCGFLHRDIKPSNFAIGSNPETCRICYMLDFGLARQYTTVTGEVRQPRPVAGFRGTVRYASLNAHLSRDLGRHDDLWSVFYLLVELAIGQLPWRRIRDKDEVGDIKAKYDHRNLIRGLPVEFGTFLNHLKYLTYFDKPDYLLIIGTLQEAAKSLKIQDSDPLDWEQDYSGRSMTVSVVSTPGMRLMDKRKDSQSLAKVSHESSQTNCSGVEDLSENSTSHQQKPEDREGSCLTPQLTPVINDVPEGSHRRHVTHKQQVDRVILNAHKSLNVGGSEIASSFKHVPNKERAMLDESVEIDNHYISEDDNNEEGKDGDFSKEILPSSQCSPLLHVEEVTQSLYMKQFFDTSPPISKCLESYKSPSNSYENKVELESSQISLDQDDKSVSSDDEVDELNNAIIYPGDCTSDQLAAIGYVTPPSDQAKLEHFEANMKGKIMEAGAQSRNNSESVSENLELAAMSEKLLQDMRVSNLGACSEVLYGSVSSTSKSVGMTSAWKKLYLISPTASVKSNAKGRLFEEVRNINASMDSTSHGTNVSPPVGSSRNNQKSQISSLVSCQNQVEVQQTSSRMAEQKQEASFSNVQEPSTELDTDKTQPSKLGPETHKRKPSSTTIPQVHKSKSAPFTNALEEEKVEKEMVKGKGTLLPTRERSADGVKKRITSLEVFPSAVALCPRPPPNPPPRHYSLTLLARRRRFLNPSVGKDTQ